MADAAPLDDPELLATAWELGHLVDGEGAEGALARLARADAAAVRFAAEHAGRMVELDGAGLAAALDELAAIHDAAGRAASYASLSFAENTADPARGALLQKVQEGLTRLQTQLLFFDLEWAALDDDRAEELMAAPGLDLYRHHLRSERRYRPHLLSEPEEKVLAEKQITARSAWTRLFEEQAAVIEVPLPGEHAPARLEVALARLQSGDREVRRTTAAAVTAGLGPGLRTRAYILNTVLADKATDDRLRSFPTWLSSRNLANEVSDASVEALVGAVRARYDIPRRWYALKATMLGVERLADYDRMAAVTEQEGEVAWTDARELVLDCYRRFSPELGGLVGRFFSDAWIDAPVRPGKRGGAFCSYTVPSVHPYVMLNWTGRRRDVLTLAHELGHGVHAALARPRGIMEQGTPLTLAETASVFGETIVFGELLARAASPEARLALLAESLEGAIATVFRQTAMNRFEALAHTERREAGELAVERLGELWAESQAEMLGDSVEITEGYRTWWSYVPHFVSTPGYVYAYAYGQLLALSVYGRYREEGEAFVPRYLAMLAAGGSRSPEELGALVGLDLTDPGFWDAGLDLVADQLTKAEAAARAAGRLG